MKYLLFFLLPLTAVADSPDIPSTVLGAVQELQVVTGESANVYNKTTSYFYTDPQVLSILRQHWRQIVTARYWAALELKSCKKIKNDKKRLRCMDKIYVGKIYTGINPNLYLGE